MAYKIGDQFIRRGKKYIETITDILTTRNTSDQVVNVRYVATHEFCGQIVTDRDVIPTTIARGKIIEK